MICQNAGHANIFEPVSVILMLQDKSSDRLNYVRSLMFDRSKPKMGCSSSITNKKTCLGLVDVRKNDVRVSSMSNLVNVVKALLGSKFDVRSFEAKNRVFEFDHQ